MEIIVHLELGNIAACHLRHLLQNQPRDFNSQRPGLHPPGFVVRGTRALLRSPTPATAAIERELAVIRPLRPSYPSRNLRLLDRTVTFSFSWERRRLACSVFASRLVIETALPGFPEERRMKLEPFELERIQSTWEHLVDYNLSESGVHPLSFAELTTNDPAALERLAHQALGYSQTNARWHCASASPRSIPGATPDHILVTNGTSEANFVTTWSLLDADDEMVVMLPNYTADLGRRARFSQPCQAVLSARRASLVARPR